MLRFGNCSLIILLFILHLFCFILKLFKIINTSLRALAAFHMILLVFIVIVRNSRRFNLSFLLLGHLPNFILKPNSLKLRKNYQKKDVRLETLHGINKLFALILFLCLCIYFIINAM